MTNEKILNHEQKDTYETTFSKSIDYELTDFISASFLYGIVDAIAERMDLKENEVKSEFSLENGTSIRTIGKSNIKKLLLDARKYGRHINGLEIKSGIVYGKDKHTHYDLSFNLHRYGHRASANIRCYAVANNRNDSQAVIDWGNGTLNDFQDLKLLEIQPEVNDLIIKLNDGSIDQWSTGDNVQKVEVVNHVSISPSKWSDKANVIAIGAIGVTILIALVGWYFFNN